jgi:hypothetical protein
VLGILDDCTLPVADKVEMILEAGERDETFPCR